MFSGEDRLVGMLGISTAGGGKLDRVCSRTG